MSSIYLTGDTHANVRRLLIIDDSEMTKDDIVIVLGDFGVIWEKDSQMTDTVLELLSEKNFTLAFLDGNHENFPEIARLEKETYWNGGKIGLLPYGIIHLLRGEIYNINGKSILVIGGAYSVDKEYRLLKGWRWFKDEQPNKEIVKYIEKQITKQRHFDIVLTHTCPIKTEPRHMFLPFIDQSKVDKTTELLLQRIADWITFDNWYFGHFHGHWDNGKYHMLFEDYVEVE